MTPTNRAVFLLMAYYVDFMSFGGTAYRVEIGAANGNPLTGAPEPFVTQEDDDGDLFTIIVASDED